MRARRRWRRQRARPGPQSPAHPPSTHRALAERRHHDQAGAAPSPAVTPTATRSAKAPGPTTELPKLQKPDPSKNENMCYDSGAWNKNARMQNTGRSFCRDLERYVSPITGPRVIESPYHLLYDAGEGSIKIVASVEILEGCEWEYNYDECIRYMKVLADSCDCSGETYKQGGVVTNSCSKWRLDPNRA